ncbi:exopolysaccharide biosynthesis WecB/TagA/CpsF family protein [Sphingomonas xinjiangensis]|uniref:Exopolysaccharide biosynthesis WecB/TagA/CpsF family protein n=2 Tax=Sphingomonas xinjiangensis TaxID=643568 RepID=A0A840YFE1_9SPHN|nr:exopolysaccharide biosynthesis WecB/TagA/CpsF family protein [Sphingomonas xinjiangensis]
MSRSRLRIEASEKRRLGHVEVEVETQRGALSRLRTAVEARSCSTWGFCNAHTVNMAAEDVRFRAAVGEITMFNDGVGVDIASRLLFGAAFPENLNGTDLTPALLEMLPEGTKVYLVGGSPDTAVRAAEAFSAMHPNVRLVGCHHGYFSDHQGSLVANQVAAADPDLILVGMGHPKQEIWAASNMRALKAPSLCVGALIDRAAGAIPRAPLWMRQLRVEWLFRLLLEPRRLAKRYLWGNGVFLIRVWRQHRASSSGKLQTHV